MAGSGISEDEAKRLARYPLCGPFIRVCEIDGQWYQQTAFGLMNPGMSILMMTYGINPCGGGEASVGKSKKRLVSSRQPD
jgi:hypothetical protein